MDFRARMVRAEEWFRLLEITGKDEDKTHYKSSLFWCEESNEEHAFLSGHVPDTWTKVPAIKTIALESIDFRPAFEPIHPDNAKEGTEIVAATLFMDDRPVLVDYLSLFEEDFIDHFIPGSKLEFRDPIADPCYQIRAIKVGDVYVATRSVLCDISWEELNVQFYGGVIPPVQASMVDLAHWQELRRILSDEDADLHWKKMHFWLSDEEGMHCGSLSPEYLGECDSDRRSEMVGFRPMFPNYLGAKPGERVAIATLLLDSALAEIPQYPTHDGDIPEYRDGVRIEFRQPLPDQEFQITAISVGDMLVADRCVLRGVSWDDLKAQGF